MAPDEAASSHAPRVQQPPSSPDLHERVNRDFEYHPPRGNQPELYTEGRRWAREFAHFIVDVAPASREQSLALTKLEEVVFWLNAAIARHG